MIQDSLETINEKAYDLIIFDCDGTLVDSEFLSNSVVAEMIRELGIPLTDLEAYKIFSGTSMSDIISYIEGQLNQPIPYDFEAKFRPRVQKVFETQLQPMPGVVSFIEKLKTAKCVASNGPRIKMETTLKVTGLDKHFSNQDIFSAYDLNKWKPDPDLFLYAVKEKGYIPERCLVIEDSKSGVTAAVRAAIDVIVIEDALDPMRTSLLGVPVMQSFDQLAKTFFLD